MTVYVAVVLFCMQVAGQPGAECAVAVGAQGGTSEDCPARLEYVVGKVVEEARSQGAESVKIESARCVPIASPGSQI